MGKYIVAILVSLTLIGCTTPNFSKGDQIPTSGKVIVDQTEYEMIPGKYAYDGERIKIRSVDNNLATELAEDFETITVEKNSNIEIVIEDHPSLTVFEWDEDEKVNEITLTDNKISVPSRSGKYIYEIQAKWPSGEASFIFDVEVK